MLCEIKANKISTILLFILGTFLGVVISFGGLDDLESRLFPIAKIENTHITENTKMMVCWKITFTKLREGSPKYFAWIMETPKGNRHYLSAFRNGLDNNDYNTIPTGTTSQIINCAFKVGNIQKVNGFYLRAYAQYRVPHGLWDIPLEIPPFK